MIIDTHCHYNLPPLSETEVSWQNHWHTAQAHDVKKSIIVGTSLETSQLALQMSQSDSNLWAAVGIHPSEYQEAPDELFSTQLSQLELLCTEPKVVAIGETGLDYFRLPDNPVVARRIREHQQQAFEGHLELALKYCLPLIIHVRDLEIPETMTPDNAYWDILSLLGAQSTLPRFVLHCISGPVTYLQQALELGAYVGVAGNVSYKNADHLRSLVKLTPQDKLVLETDAPFLPPQAHRGQPCEPWMISLTAEYLEEELGLDQNVLTQNAEHLFPQLQV